MPALFRLRSPAARLLIFWVRIPPRAWMSVCCACCVLSGRGLCGELITRSEESYWLCCVVVCDLETSWMRRPWPTGEMLRQMTQNNIVTKHSLDVNTYNRCNWKLERVLYYLICDQPRGLVVRISDYQPWGSGFDSRFYHGNFSL